MDVIEAIHGRRSIRAYRSGPGQLLGGRSMPWLRSAGVAEELGLPRGYDVVVAVVAVVLGHPAESPAGNPRLRPPIVWSPA